jgi:hypothetical protein
MQRQTQAIRSQIDEVIRKVLDDASF